MKESKRTVKTSIYFPVDVRQELNKLYSMFILAGEKRSLSDITSSAITTYAKLAQAVQDKREQEETVPGQTKL